MDHPDKPVLVLLPELGADAALFRPQQAAFPDLIVPRWIRPQPKETLQAYAQRFAESLSREVPRTGPLFIGGMSFGGIIAVEMARHMRPLPAGIFLIGSSRLRKGVPARFRVAQTVARPVPRKLGGPIVKWFLRSFAKREDLGPDGTRLVREMAARLDLEVLKWGGRAIVAWKGADNPGVPIFHIHGRRDWVFPMVKGEPDHVIPNGRHLINISHAAEVNAYLAEKMRKRHGAEAEAVLR